MWSSNSSGLGITLLFLARTITARPVLCPPDDFAKL